MAVFDRALPMGRHSLLREHSLRDPNLRAFFRIRFVPGTIQIMNRMVPSPIIAALLIAAFSFVAGAVAETVPTYDTLKELARELNKTAIRAGETRTRFPREVNPERAARGAELYAANCLECHGEGAQGASNWHLRDAAGNFPPPPLNGSAHTWHHPKTQLMEIIRNGGTGMPAFGSKLPDRAIEAIIHWFQSLWPDEVYQAWARQNEAYQREP